MSRLANAIEHAQHDERYVAPVGFDITSTTTASDVGFDTLYHYSIGVRLGRDVMLRREDLSQLDYIKERVRRDIIHWVFGEFQDDLIAIESAIWMRDFDKAKQAVDELRERMFG